MHIYYISALFCTMEEGLYFFRHPFDCERIFEKKEYRDGQVSDCLASSGVERERHTVPRSKFTMKYGVESK